MLGVVVSQQLLIVLGNWAPAMDAAVNPPGTGPHPARRRQRTQPEEAETTSRRDMSVCGPITWGLLGLLCIGGPTSEQLLEHVSTPHPGFGDKERFMLVSLHNKLRGSVRPSAANMRRMAWSEALGARALAVASRCQQNAVDHPEVGWNLQRFPAGTATPADAVILWFRQENDYNFWTSECGQKRTCRHYTQLVWASSWELGCGMSRCSSDMGDVDMVVCAYSPGGNWDIGGRLSAPIKRAPGAASVRQADLAALGPGSNEEVSVVPRNPCRMSCGEQGTLNTSSCQCDCARGYTGRLCQVRCRSRCLHGRHKATECSCECDAGYGGADCAEQLKSPAPPCDLLTDGVCFMVSVELRSYYKAKIICQEAGGRLAEIRMQKLQDILSFFLGQLEDTNKTTDGDSQTPNFWIGLTYKSRFSSFRWDSGDLVSFQSFALGQPDSAGFQNCVEMSARSRFNWNAQRCKTSNRYICQYKT